eukprot:6200623-Pleurochrysis_carterae.AAC.2
MEIIYAERLKLHSLAWTRNALIKTADHDREKAEASRKTVRSAGAADVVACRGRAEDAEEVVDPAVAGSAALGTSGAFDAPNNAAKRRVAKPANSACAQSKTCRACPFESRETCGTNKTVRCWECVLNGEEASSACWEC